MAFDALVGLRITRELQARYQRLARQPEHRGRDVADLMRMALEDWCDDQERILKLLPITPEEVEEFTNLILAERSQRSGATPRPPVRPVTYTKGKAGATGKGGTPRKPRGTQS